MSEKNNSTIEEKLVNALQSRQKNDLEDAEKLYNEILETDTKNFEATFSLGTIFLEQENSQLACPIN